MTSSTERTFDGVPDDVQQTLRAYVKEVRAAYGERLNGIVLYGSAVRGEFLPGRSNLNILLSVPAHDVALLQAYTALHTRWGKEQIVVPLFMTVDDLRSASLLFPLEYLDMQECHRVLWGQDPFAGIAVDRRHLAVEIVQSLRNNLLRVRQRFVEGGGTEEAITVLLPLSVTALLPALRGVQRVLGQPVSSQGDDLLDRLASQLGIDGSGLRDAWSLKRGHITPGKQEVPRLMARYLDSLERVVRTVEERLGQGTR